MKVIHNVRCHIGGGGTSHLGEHLCNKHNESVAVHVLASSFFRKKAATDGANLVTFVGGGVGEVNLRRILGMNEDNGVMGRVTFEF